MFQWNKFFVYQNYTLHILLGNNEYWNKIIIFYITFFTNYGET